jgi:hypothetical protein
MSAIVSGQQAGVEQNSIFITPGLDPGVLFRGTKKGSRVKPGYDEVGSV